MAAQKITIQGFLSKFINLHTTMPDRPFCWVLGSGASVQSRIPSGGELAMQWLKDLHIEENFDNLPLEQWATAKTLGIDGFDFATAANFYPWIYQRRFRDDPDEGYAFLESKMADAEPSYGYSVLAQIMAGTQHQVAVTTNFDNLVADALSTYTSAFPLVCGHESLTGYIRAKLRRPLIAKIHRDLLLQPLSQPGEIQALPKEWAAALKVIFDNYTPIVIGYGGNDGSLMGFLEKLDRIKGGIFWCYRTGSEPESKVHEVVERHHGRLVPILGFDELMLQLWEKLGLTSPIPDLEKTHKQRVTDWQKQFEELNKRLKEPAKTNAAEEELRPVREAAAAAAERLTKEKDWLAWQLKADAEKDPADRERIYRDGLADFPASHWLMTNFAVWLEKGGGHRAEVAELYSAAYRLEPNNPIVVANYAWCLHEYKKEYDEAERLYRKGLELEPKHALHAGNFALFMQNVRKDYDEAERLYRKALELAPNDAGRLNGLGWFLTTIRKRYEEAEPLLRRAVALAPNDGSISDSLAVLLSESGQNLDEAEQLFEQAVKLAPDDEEIAKNFAEFKKKHRGGKA